MTVGKLVPGLIEVLHMQPFSDDFLDAKNAIEMLRYRACVASVVLYDTFTALDKNVLKGQVHGSAYAYLSKCCYSAGTSYIVIASNMILS